ncbi:histone-lysine N-methyltransferase SETMAR-like [Stegodyphus dumicola]|uniref:histone-lysine N-methyltransferase SETMAR-like n=1 Tax=Stegodyphus dumicola TaxID=202533 RepID=UPI0015B154A1|nr:histone-lysine N-methyltransferase SETMAR-like [Stegodyphus dumicola]
MVPTSSVTHSLYDNVRPHVVRKARDTIQLLGWETLPPSTILPRPHTNRLLPFPFPGQPSSWEILQQLDRPQKGLTDFSASKTPEFYCNCITQLATCWQKAVDADGDYFEN